MFEVEFREDIGKAIPHIVECLDDPSKDVCTAAAKGLASLAAYRTCPFVSPAGVLNNVPSGITGGNWQGHTSHC